MATEAAEQMEEQVGEEMKPLMVQDKKGCPCQEFVTADGRAVLICKPKEGTVIPKKRIPVSTMMLLKLFPAKKPDNDGATK